MEQCEKCGKELKHKGALTGHMAFVHGVQPKKSQKLAELREEVDKLRADVDYFKGFLHKEIIKGADGRKEETLTGTDTLSGNKICFEKTIEAKEIEE